MPLILPEDLLSDDVLEREGIFTMDPSRAKHQDIRPLKVAIVNLMPNKEETELQLLKMLTNTALQIEIDLVHMDSYRGSHTGGAHLDRFYKTYGEIKDCRYDGMIITGAPVEKLPYDEIRYWDELKMIFDFAKTNVYSTLFICWSAQAALHYFYGVESEKAAEKIFGIYRLSPLKESVLFRGFDDVYAVPQSRHTFIAPESLKGCSDVDLLSAHDDLGVALAETKDHRFIFQFGHWEYDKHTLHNEYLRDLAKNEAIAPPLNYYEQDNPEGEIRVQWRSAANLFFTNWLNYCVYQETPYYLRELSSKPIGRYI